MLGSSDSPAYRQTMSFSYTDTLAASKDKVRFIIGDTDTTYALFTDEEILAAIDEAGDDWYKAGGKLLQALANDPDRMLTLHDAAGRTFTMSRLSSLMASFSDRWMGRG